VAERYIRQTLFEPIGSKGQLKLKKSKVAVIGAGGLGSVISVSLARAGVGFLRIADNDNLDITNLHRQLLYDENDLEKNSPKVFIAKDKLLKINSDTIIEAVNIRVTENNILDIIEGMDIVLDGTDNFDIRFIINEACIKKGIPWIFGAAAGSHGMIFNIIPKETPCLNCIFPELPGKDYIQTSANAGILNTIVTAVGSIQTTEALKYLTGNKSNIFKDLLYIDLWYSSFESIKVSKPVNSCCRICGFKQVF